MIEYSRLNYIYIGSTKNIKNRLLQHDAVNTKKWIRRKEKWEYWNKDIRGSITLTILEFVPVEERYFWESFYMDLFRSWGLVLKNKNRILKIN